MTSRDMTRRDSTTGRRPAIRTAALAALLPVALVLGGCGSAASTGSAGASPGPSQRGNGGGAFGQGGGGFAGGAGFPGASGLIAAVSPGTLQVQSTDAQTTVTYGSSTRFTQVVAATLAAGDCVMVTGTPVSGSQTALTATSVRVVAKVAGACPTNAGRNGNGNGNGNGSASGDGNNGGGFFGQSGSPRPRPSGAPSGSQVTRALAFATGTVTAVSGSTVTVQGVLRAPRFGAGASASAQPQTPTSLTVTLGSDTLVTTTVAATSKAAVAGMCATALGKADDRGDIAATSITVSKPDANGCRAGAAAFGFGFGGGRQGGGSGSSA